MTLRTCQCGANLDPNEICDCIEKGAPGRCGASVGDFGGECRRESAGFPQGGFIPTEDLNEKGVPNWCGASVGEAEERWLAARKKGIGASEAACILGLNPWKSGVRLWEEKTGRVPTPDIASKAAVRYGKLAEEPLRELFALDFPNYTVGYNEFDVVRKPEQPWLFATLDGDLTEKTTGRRGVLEIKTTEIQRSADWDKWSGRVPDYYYIQLLHQLLATGFEFAVLKAQIKWHKDGDLNVTIRHYFFEKENCLADMDYLLGKEIDFWACVTEDKRPALVLPEI